MFCQRNEVVVLVPLHEFVPSCKIHVTDGRSIGHKPLSAASALSLDPVWLGKMDWSFSAVCAGCRNLAPDRDAMGPVSYPSFAQLYAATSDAVFINQGDTIVDCNQAAASLYEMRIDEIVGRSISELVPENFVESMAARAMRLTRGLERDRLTTEEILKPDGTRIPVTVRSIPFERDDVRYLMVLLRAIDTSFVHPDADSERAELFTAVSLRLAQAPDDELDKVVTETLQQIAISQEVDRAYLVIFVGDGNYLRCTHEWCADGIEPQIDYVQNLPDGDFEYSGSLLRSGEIFYAPRLDHLPPEARAERESFGRYGVQSVLQVPMRVSGRAYGVVGFNAVNQSRTWTETSIALLQAVADAMATALVRRDAHVEAERARRRAEAANQAKNLFLSRVSHELRTPLNAVLGFTELLLLDRDRSESDRQALGQINTSGTYLLRLVEDLLDISRIESGHLSLSTEPVDLGDVISAAQSMVSSAGLDSEVTIRVDIDDGLPLVMADLQRLRQVVVNLLSNACKYNLAGGSVYLSASREGRWVRLQVRDTGVGIPPELLSRVFEPFDRLGREHSDVEGSGIGLTLTRSLVDLMGGQIQVESQVDQGTTVTVSLVAAGSASARESEDAGLAVDPNLVASLDPSPGSRTLLRRVVEDVGGLEFVGASSTKELLSLLSQRLPAVLFAEVEADDPVRTRFIEMLDTDTRLRRIAVVIVSGSQNRELVERAIGAGAVDFAQKPVPIDRLRELVINYTN